MSLIRTHYLAAEVIGYNTDQCTMHEPPVSGIYQIISDKDWPEGFSSSGNCDLLGKGRARKNAYDSALRVNITADMVLHTSATLIY